MSFPKYHLVSMVRGEENMESLTYSIKSTPTSSGFDVFGTILFGTIASILFLLSIYFFSLGAEYVVLGMFCFLFAFGFGLVSLNAHKSHKKRKLSEYQLAISEKGMEETFTYGNKSRHKFTPILKIDHVLIGNYVGRALTKNESVIRTRGVLIAIMHGQHTSFCQIFDDDERNSWIKFLIKYNFNAYYTEYDLTEAYDIHETDVGDNHGEKIDFRRVEGKPLEKLNLSQLPSLGQSVSNNRFKTWSYTDKNKAEKRKAVKTKKVDYIVTCLFFVLSIILGGFIMPSLPVDNGELVFNGSASLFITGILLIPPLFVYWRDFTKWYMPLVYCLVTLTGTILSVSIVSLFMEFSPPYTDIINIYIFSLLLCWYLLLGAVKLLKSLFLYVKRWF